MTENKGDLISRSALRKAFKNHPLCNDVWLQYSRELIDNAPTVCGNNPKWCESCVSKGKCASTSTSEKQSRKVRLEGNQGKMTIDLDKKPIG